MPADTEDYYYENGLMVFTAKYLMKRGWCCQFGCRHCPYGYKPPPEPGGESCGNEPDSLDANLSS